MKANKTKNPKHKPLPNNNSSNPNCYSTTTRPNWTKSSNKFISSSKKTNKEKNNFGNMSIPTLPTSNSIKTFPTLLTMINSITTSFFHKINCMLCTRRISRIRGISSIPWNGLITLRYLLKSTRILGISGLLAKRTPIT